VKKPQLILAGICLSLVFLLFVFGRFVPEKEKLTKAESGAAAPAVSSFSIDSARSSVEKSLTGELNLSLKNLEQKLKAASTSATQLAAYHAARGSGWPTTPMESFASQGPIRALFEDQSQ